MLRGIADKISGDFFLHNKVLIVPILTGTALMEFNSIEAVVGTSTYQPAIISVGRLSEKHAIQLTFKAANLGDNNLYTRNIFCTLLVETGGGVPLWQRNISLVLRDTPALDTMQEAGRVWQALWKSVELQYHASLDDHLLI